MFFGNANNQYLSTYARGYLPSDDPLGDVNYSASGPTFRSWPSDGSSRHRATSSPRSTSTSRGTARLPGEGAHHGLRLPPTGHHEYQYLRGTVGLGQFSGADQQQLVEVRRTEHIFPATNPPQIASINAHYDHFRALPADNAAQRESILLTSADVAPGSTSGRVISTMGCHSALPVSDFVVGDPLNADRSQAYARGGAIVYMGNTGYGLGDTAAVLYSEKLNVLFAARLDGSITVGQALAFAKQDYAATPTLSGYHSKVIDEATMMGLPMYRVGSGTPPAPPRPRHRQAVRRRGFPSTSFSV